MKMIIVGNILIEIGWIIAMVFLIINEYPWWAGGCLFGAIFSGTSYTLKEPTKKDKIWEM